MREYKLKGGGAPPPNKLTDDSKMPFGKHKDAKMKDVPAQYLLWLWDNGVHADTNKPVHHYIKDNFNSLEQDAPDYIVEHKP